MKNHILVSTIAQGATFNTDGYLDDARAIVLDLAQEQAEAADHITRQRKRAHGRHSDPVGTHDYRDRDVRNLRRRAKQYNGVAQRLRAIAEDDEQLRSLIDAAREAAWSDVANNLQRRLVVEGMRADQDPEYQQKRDARMQALKLVDLQALASEQRARKKRQQAADDAAEKNGRRS